MRKRISFYTLFQLQLSSKITIWHQWKNIWPAFEQQCHLICYKNYIIKVRTFLNQYRGGWVSWSKSVVYLTSPGSPTDIGLQLGKVCFLAADKGRGECFYFFRFFSCIHFPFSPVPLFHLLYFLLSLFSLSLGDDTKMTDKGWRVVKPQLDQKILNQYTYQPWHSNFYNLHVRAAKTQIRLRIRAVWSESSLCALWIPLDPMLLHADSEDSD